MSPATSKFPLSRRRLLAMAGTGAGLSLSGILHRAAAAAPGGEIVWGKPLETTMFDPHTSILGSSWQVLHMIYDSLVDMDNLKPVPKLAVSWDNPDPKTWVFQIRKGVKFSNGREMTVADVIGSIQRVADPKTGSFFINELGKIDKVEKTGDQEVTLRLGESFGPVLDALSATMTSILPMEELRAGRFDPTKAMMGTGPFMVQSHVQDDHWVLVRNPHYWQSGLPKLDQVTIRIMPPDAARIAGLRDGTVDIASFEASPDAPLLVKDIPNVTVHIEDVSNYYFFAMNAVWDKSPFRNAKLRQAVALTIDRNRIRDLALGGAGDPTTVMAPAFKACNSSKLAYWNPDLAKAKSLLKQSGAEAISFELLVRNIPADIQMTQVIKDGVAEIGLTANIAVVEEGIWVKRAWVDNPSQFQAMVTWYAGYSDPVMSTLWWNPKIAGFTAGHVPYDQAIADAIEKGFTTPKNDPTRAGVLQHLCELIDEQAVKVPLCTRQDTIAFRSDRIKANLAHFEGYVNTLHGIEAYQKV